MTELDSVERRVLGALIEKERATPQYPLTLNSLRLACNQTTAREPVVSYDDRTVEEALASLRAAGWTRIVYSPSNRAAKYRHVVDEVLGLDHSETAVLCVLLLRGAQTSGEIKGRSERLHTFADLKEVETTLEGLAARSDPLVVRLERRPGQKDARWSQMLGGAPDEPVDRAVGADGGRSSVSEVAGQVSDLRTEVAQVRSELDDLRRRFDALLADLT